MSRVSKSVVSLLISALMVAGFFATPNPITSRAAERETSAVNIPITIETVQASAGDTDVEVKVFIPTGWSGIGLTFHFNPAKLTYKSFVANKAIQDQAAAGEPNVYALNKNNAFNGEVIVSFASAVVVNGFEGYSNVDEDGNSYDYFGTFKFDVAANANGLQTITATVDKLVYSDSNNNTFDIPYYLTNGGIHVGGEEPPEPYDSIPITIETVQASAGDTNVQVKFFIPTGWSGIGLTFHFDPAKLTYKSFVTNKAIQDQAAAGVPNVYALNKNNASNGEVIVSFASAVVANGFEGYSNVDEDGNSYDYFGTFKFNVAANANGLQTITATVDKLVNSDSNNNTFDIPYYLTNGGIQVGGEQPPVDPCDHEWGEWEVTTPATCVAKGEKTRTCSKCQETETEEIDIDPDAHDWGEWEDCADKEGYEQRVCKNDPSHVEERKKEGGEEPPVPYDGIEFVIETVEAAAGDKGVEVKLYAPTGWTGIGLTFHFNPEQLTYKSFVTNKAIQDQAAAGEPNVYALNKNNASNGEVIVSFASAVVVNGFEGYSNVDEDGNSYDYFGTFKFDVAANANGLQTITATVDKLVGPEGDLEGKVTAGGIFIDGHSHTWGEWTITTPATCSTAGVKTRACTKCGEEETAVIPIDEEAHDWVETDRTPATCTTEGYVQYACAINPNHTMYEVLPIDSEAHQWGAWSVTIPSTCTEAGEEARLCTRCWAIETRELPLAPHSWSEWTVTIPNTYKSTGEEARICPDCGKIETRILPVAQITGISVTTLPNKTKYTEGSEFDITGAALTLYYDNNTTRFATVGLEGSLYKLFFSDEPVPEVCTVTGFDSATIGDQTIVLNYKDHLASFTITVREKSVVSIEFLTLPSKITFDIGEPININGGTVTVYYDNNTTETARLMSVAGYNRLIINSSSISSEVVVSGYNPDAVGVQTITIEYEDVTASYNVIVGGMLGDIDFDGTLTVYDALLILRVAAKLDSPSEAILTFGDIDNDGNITVYDALLVLRVVAKLNEHL